MNRADFQNLATIRLAEAQALLVSGHSSGAYYLAGYAVECALKACIARRTREHDFPPRPETVRDMYTHDLTRLVKTAGLQEELDRSSQTDPQLDRFWSTVRAWSEQTRYLITPPSQAGDLIQAVEDPQHGVLLWLQRYW